MAEQDNDTPLNIDLSIEPVLEAPPVDSSPEAAINTGLFQDDTFTAAPVKLSALEAFLGLLVRDIKFHDFMREILLVMIRTVKCEAGSIIELNHEENTLFFRAVVGSSSDRVEHFVIPMGKGIVGYVAESRLPLVVANVEENQQHLKSVGNAVGFETRNLVAVPILVRGKVYGVLELLNRIGDDNFSTADVETITYLCDAAAKIIETRLMLGWAMNILNGAKAA